MARLDFGGLWWAAVPREHWPQSPSFQTELDPKWHPEVGDCRQELVFIGIGLDEDAITQSLAECLLTDEEYSLGIRFWLRLPDPFPPWDLSMAEALEASAHANIRLFP